MVRYPVPWHDSLGDIALLSLYSVSLTETVFLSSLLFLGSCQEVAVCIIFYSFCSLRLAPRPNNLLSAWGCILGTLFFKPKFLGRIFSAATSTGVKEITGSGRRQLSRGQEPQPGLGCVREGEREKEGEAILLKPCCSPIHALISALGFWSTISSQSMTKQMCSGAAW